VLFFSIQSEVIAKIHDINSLLVYLHRTTGTTLNSISNTWLNFGIVMLEEYYGG
jgi:hypothetical protein